MAPDRVRQEVSAFVATGQQELIDDWLWQLPLQEFQSFRRTGNVAPYYDEWLVRPSYDDYWATLDVETKYPRIQVPALVTGGWYDVFQEGTIRNFLGTRKMGGSDVARNDTKLIIRALCHTCPADTTAGEIRSSSSGRCATPVRPTPRRVRSTSDLTTRLTSTLRGRDGSTTG